MSKKRKSTAIYTAENAPAVFADENVEEPVSEKVITEDSSVITEETKSSTSEVKQEEKIASAPKVPESFFTNLVKVRIIGRHRASGFKLMSLVGIANAVVENVGDYIVVTSSQSAASVCMIIREFGDRLDVKDISKERKEKLIKVFLADCNRYKM